MPKQRAVPATGPTLPPEKSIPILENLVAEADKLYQEAADSPLRQDWINNGEAALQAALGLANPATDAFSLAQCGVSSIYDTPQLRLKQANDQLRGMVGAINTAVKQLRWQLPDPSHVFLPAGSTHSAYVEIRKVCSAAVQSITIVDSYVDDTLWPLLTNVPATTEISILTMRMKGDFPLEGKKFIAQHKNKVEIRTTKSYHDRFILLDGTKCWHLGASIKDAGLKAFAMSEIISPGIAAAVKADVQAAWAAGSVVTL